MFFYWLSLCYNNHPRRKSNLLLPLYTSVHLCCPFLGPPFLVSSISPVDSELALLRLLRQHACNGLHNLPRRNLAVFNRHGVRVQDDAVSLRQFNSGIVLICARKLESLHHPQTKKKAERKAQKKNVAQRERGEKVAWRKWERASGKERRRHR